MRRFLLISRLYLICGIFLRDVANAFTTSHGSKVGRYYRLLVVSTTSSSITTNSTTDHTTTDSSSSATASSSSTTSSDSVQQPEPLQQLNSKDIVRLFGRLAERYIALDASAGKCCYSGCTDCEYRLPSGGYRMAEQTAARPKWIPTYISRVTADATHHTKWSTSLFKDDDITTTTPTTTKTVAVAVSTTTTTMTNEENMKKDADATAAATTRIVLTKDQFLQRLIALEYVPPLGGPYVSASSSATATLADNTMTVLERFYQLLTQNERYPLTMTTMKRQLQKIAAGEEGITWAVFEQALLSTTSSSSSSGRER